MKYQVVVKLGDRVWDSIRETPESAFLRVCEHMSKAEPEIVCTAKAVKMKLIFGKGIHTAKSVFEDAGFSVDIKQLA